MRMVPVTSLPPTVATVEVVWFLTGALPLIYDLIFLWGLRQAQLKLRADGRNGADDLAIRGHIGTNWIVALGHITIATIGVATMTIPPTVTASPVALTANQLIVTLGFFVLSALFTAFTFWHNHSWRSIGRYVSEHANHAADMIDLHNLITQLHIELERNTSISQTAATQAEQAYTEANHINLKIESAILLGNSQTDAVLGKQVEGKRESGA